MERKEVYRCDAFNAVEYKERLNPVDVIENEVFDYNNVDIFDTVNELYCDNDDAQLHAFSVVTADGDIEDDVLITGDVEWSVEDVTNYILDVVKNATRVQVKYLLWLADLDSVISDYYEEDSDYPIMKFDVSQAVVVSDLGGDGILYGFTDFPKPIATYDTPDDVK